MLAGSIRIVFLPNHAMATALAMVSGADIWLNTPQPTRISADAVPRAVAST